MCLSQTRSHSVLLMGTGSSTALTRLSSSRMVNLNPLFSLAMVTTRTACKGRERDGQDEGGEVVTWNLFMFVIFYTYKFSPGRPVQGPYQTFVFV
jgi:hypothetical protein